MKIQYISYATDQNFESDDITCRTLSDPLAFDNFGITVVSLQDYRVWQNTDSGFSRVNCMKDLNNIGLMTSASIKSLILFLLPQDYVFKSSLSYGEYRVSTPIRVILPDVSSLICDSLGIDGITLSPGAEITHLNHGGYSSAFSISNMEPPSEGCIWRGNGNGITVFRAGDCAVTTIRIKDSATLFGFLEDIDFIREEAVFYPEWLNEISILDEASVHDRLEANRTEIAKLENECASLEERLAECRSKKLILCTKGSQLQDNVVSMLEEIFPRDEKFVDVGEEDYRFETANRAFLFEVKGSEKSLKRDHVSKTDNHVQVFLDSRDDDRAEKVPKGILIFSEEIGKPLSEHLPYVEAQIDLARKYGVLVIPALGFLRLYEKILQGEISSEQVQEDLWSKTGLWTD
ncbi:MAG: hypothetical protein HFJ66_01525 [Eggerthellaceae bacterium]|nr:hypothetical protein [Eggerthellaceae bacterium]